jgi:hypothetical protein
MCHIGGMRKPLSFSVRIPGRPETAKPEPAPAVPETASATPAADNPAPAEIGGPKGPDPTRFGDWEIGGRCIDF